jgi:hypothetical protein
MTVEHRRDRRDEEREHASHVRPVSKRPVPFIAIFMVGYVLFPILFAASRGYMLLDPANGLWVAHAWFVAGVLTAFMAVCIGLLHARRTTFLIKHIVLTALLAGLAGDVFTLAGWRHPKLDIVAFFGTGVLCVSWCLYRIDAFRAKAKGESGDTWGELIGLLRSQPTNVKVSEGQVSFDVVHGDGEKHEDVARGMAHVANAGHVLTGRAQVVEGERGGVSHVSFSTADSFANWLPYPGPSHPGASFAMPTCTAYYENGEKQWMSLTPNPFASPWTSFRSHIRSHAGGAGITGAGKSGWFNNIATDLGFTRCDVCVAWVDAEKLMQNAGWCMDFLTLAAGSPEQAKILTRGLRGAAEWRVQVLGQAALDAAIDPSAPFIGREWSAEAAQALHLPAWLIIVDEADTIIRTKAWEWLSARGASLGFFLVLGAPRVSTAEVSALLRGSVGIWKTFGMGDQISDMFTLPHDIKDTVDPSKWRDSGLHVLTGASGVERRKWSWLAREYQNDVRVLREIIIATRAGRLVDRETRRPVCQPFDPMEPSEEEQRWLGEAWEKLRPEVLMKMRPSGPTRHEDGDVPAVPEDPARRGVAVDDTPTVPAAQVADDDSDDVDDAVRTQGGKRVVKTSAAGTIVDDDELAAIDNSAVDAEVAAEMAGVDPLVPFDTRVPPGPSIPVPMRKPKVSPDAEEREIDEAIARLYAAGKTVVANQDVLDECRVHVSASTMSRKLHRYAEGDRIIPPGLVVEQDDAAARGRFLLIPRPPRPHR